jgi:hypothetical protein
MSPYFSLCSLACIACAVRAVAQLVWLNISGDRCDSLQSLSLQSIDTLRKGVIWLLLGTAAEVPPVVTSEFLVRVVIAHLNFGSQVFILLNLNGNSSSGLCQTPIDHHPPRDLRSIQHRMLELSSLELFLIVLFNADVPADVCDHDDHRWNPDVPLSGRLYYQFHRCVRPPPPRYVLLLTWVDIVLQHTWIYEPVVLQLVGSRLVRWR